MDMRKSIALAAVCAVCLSGCQRENNFPENVTVVPTETTSLTVTEIFTDEEFLPYPEKNNIEKINFVIFDPFADKQKADASQVREIGAAMERISDAYSFFNRSQFSEKSKYYNNYADKDTVLEQEEFGDMHAPVQKIFYCPVNPEFASTEEALVQRMQEAFTEHYFPEEYFNEVLFLGGSYKTIDGTLCIRMDQYSENAYTMPFDDIQVCSCDGRYASVIVPMEGDPYDGMCFYLTLEKSEEYGWRIDEIQFCYPEQASLIYNALSLKTETLNKILDGGNVPANARTIIADGVQYVETDLDMTISEMKEFFANTFENESIRICDTYTEKYINGVYYESEGVLYRDKSAKRWFLPELELDIFMDNSGRKFHDNYREREYLEEVKINAYGSDGEYTKLLIASFLPIVKMETPMPTEPYDPFPNAVKLSDEVRSELREAMAKTSDAIAFLYGNVTGFEEDSDYSLTYADESRPMEENPQEEYVYYPLNPDYAATKEQLVQRIRAAFTENYISDEEIEKTLFEADERGNVPEYKVIDGILCLCYRYMGVMTKADRNNFYVMSYDGDHAEIIAQGYSIDEPSYIPISLVRSEEYGWRLDRRDRGEYYSPELCSVIYNGLCLRTEKLNAVLGGGNVPETPKTITVDGENYTERILDMSIDGMKSFFFDMFGKDAIIFSESGQWKEQYPLRDEYIRKYIDDVYYEQDGVIYRRDSAPEMYLPEAAFDPYVRAEHSQHEYNSAEMDSDDFCGVKINFTAEDGSVITEEIVFKYSALYNNYRGEKLEYVNILSELPILEKKN